jgi:hypothetical protein
MSAENPGLPHCKPMKKLIIISVSIALAALAQAQSSPQNSHKPTTRHPKPRIDDTTSSQTGTTQSLSGPIIPSLITPLVVGGTWTALGPQPIPNGQTEPANANGISLTQAPVSGRLTAIAIDPADPNTAYVGAAQGGVYQTRDGGTTWTPLMDSADTQAVGSLELDPTDATGNTLLVGSGESNFSGDSYAGLGVYKLTALKTSPVLTGPIGGSQFAKRSIPGLAIDPNHHDIVYVGSSTGQQGIGPQAFVGAPARGLFRSTDFFSGASTFTKLAVANIPSTADFRVTSIVYEPGSSDRMFVGIADASGNIDPLFIGGIYFTANASAPTPTFTRVLETFSGRSGATGKNFVPSEFAPIKLAATKVGSTVTVVAVTGESVPDGNQGKAYKAVYDAVKFNPQNVKFNELNAARGFAGGQGFYNIAVAIDPTNAANIYVAGTLSANGENDGGVPLIDDGLQRTGDQAVNGAGDGIDTGPNGVFIFSKNGGSIFTPSTDTLHVDSHMVGVAPSNPLVVYTGNDGGVWRSLDGAAHWIDRNTSTFSATQFQSIAVHPTDPNFSIGGTQDNGTNFFQPNRVWTRVDFGDGGYSLIDQNATDTEHVTMYHTYFNQTNNLIGFGRVLKTSCATEGQWSFRGAYTPPVDPTVHCDGTTDVFNGISLSDPVNFYAPMALGPGNPNTVYFGTNKLYRSADKGDTMPAVSQAFPSIVSAIGISRTSDNVRIVGLNNGKVFATITGGNPLTDITQTGMPAKYLARAVVDPNSVNTAYVAYNGNGSTPTLKHIFKTTNLNDTGTGTVTWTEVDNGIPDVSVNAFVVDPTDSTHLYAGTDRGVFVSTDGGANWNQFGTGLPNVAVFDLAISSDGHLRAATHGRGFYEIVKL